MTLTVVGGGIILLLGGIALLIGLSSLREWNRARSTEHTSIRDAAVTNGPLSVNGEVQPLSDESLISPIKGDVCVAYDYRIERRSGDSWSPLDFGSDSIGFLVDDGTAVGYVDPSSSELQLSTERVSDVDPSDLNDEIDTKPSLAGRRRHYEGTLSPGDDVYIRGFSEGTQQHGDADMQFVSGSMELAVSNKDRVELMSSQLKKGVTVLLLGFIFLLMGLWILI